MSRGVIKEILAYLKGHRHVLLMLVPMALAVTLLHEAALALAVAAQGGTIESFVFIPSQGRWGYITYSFHGKPYNAFIIAIAPYLLWLLLAGGAWLLTLRKRAYPYWLAGMIFLWLFIIPLGDIANAALPFLFGALNDFHRAFGPPKWFHGLAFMAMFIATVLAGFHLQRRLYRERRLSIKAYGVLSGLAAILILLFIAAFYIF